VSSIINKIKQSTAGISWPNFKSVCGDTIMVFLTASTLSILIALWSCGVEEIINWVTSLF
jgi:preprotein translocase subunit SecE